jgi:hypothetical protein
MVCAVMRKLLRIMFAVLKSGKPFDVDFKSQVPMATRSRRSSGCKVTLRCKVPRFTYVSSKELPDA